MAILVDKQLEQLNEKQLLTPRPIKVLSSSITTYRDVCRSEGSLKYISTGTWNNQEKQMCQFTKYIGNPRTVRGLKIYLLS